MGHKLFGPALYVLLIPTEWKKSSFCYCKVVKWGIFKGIKRKNMLNSEKTY